MRRPRLSGDPTRLQALIDAVCRSVTGPDGPLATDEPVGAWLRGFRLEPGEADLRLAAELGCRGQLVSSLAFDALRARLPDTDIFVSLERPLPPDTLTA